jgi:hypothetical protein
MAYKNLVRSHVERCLQDIWDVRSPEVDEEGDYPFKTKVCFGWVRVEPQPPVMVRVFAHAAYEVKSSTALFKEINSLNARSRLATVSWASGVVSVHAALPAEPLDRPSLKLALDMVSSVADDIGELTAAVFGGHPASRTSDHGVSGG